MTPTDTTHRSDMTSPAEAARARLAETGCGLFKTITCSFADGRIILNGQVPSYYHKQLAQEALRRTREVVQIVNNLEVV